MRPSRGPGKRRDHGALTAAAPSTTDQALRGRLDWQVSLVEWARSGSAPRRDGTFPSVAKPTPPRRSIFGRLCTRRAVGSGYTLSSPKGALPTSSCRGAGSRSLSTAASGTGALTMAARRRGRDPMLHCGPKRCDAMGSVTNGRRGLLRSRVGAWFESGSAKSGLIPTAWPRPCSPDGVLLGYTARSTDSALSGADSDAPHSGSPGASYRGSKLLSSRT